MLMWAPYTVNVLLNNQIAWSALLVVKDKKCLFVRQWLQQRTQREISRNVYDIKMILVSSHVDGSDTNEDMAENVYFGQRMPKSLISSRPQWYLPACQTWRSCLQYFLCEITESGASDFIIAHFFYGCLMSAKSLNDKKSVQVVKIVIISDFATLAGHFPKLK